MDSQTLVEAYKEAGFTCITTESTAWLMGEHRVALSLPTLVDVSPSRSEIRQLWRQGARITRFPAAADLPSNCVEFVLTAHPYDLSAIKQKARNQTRRGMEQCEVRRATEKDLLTRGLEINRQTLERQGRSSQFLGDEARWSRYVRTFLKLPDVDAFVACVEGQVAAYMLTMTVNDKALLVHPFLDRAFAKHYPINTIVYTAINEVRAKHGPLPVSYGLESVWKLKGLDHFKIGMGFEAVDRLVITLFSAPARWALNPALAKIFHAVPGVRARIGQKYGRMVEEKQTGMAWRKRHSRP